MSSTFSKTTRRRSLDSTTHCKTSSSIVPRSDSRRPQPQDHGLQRHAAAGRADLKVAECKRNRVTQCILRRHHDEHEGTRHSVQETRFTHCSQVSSEGASDGDAKRHGMKARRRAQVQNPEYADLMAIKRPPRVSIDLFQATICPPSFTFLTRKSGMGLGRVRESPPVQLCSPRGSLPHLYP